MKLRVRCDNEALPSVTRIFRARFYQVMLLSITVEFAYREGYCIMDELVNYLCQFAKLTRSDIGYLGLHVREISLARDEYLLDIDEIPKAMCFVKRGVLRTGYYNTRGDEVTKRFVMEHRFVSDVYAFHRQRPSQEFVQAALDSILVTFTPDALRHLSTLIVGWETMMAKIAIRMLHEKDNDADKEPGTSAALRYKMFERSHPGLVDRIGLCHVASYLGISKPTLSRIRRKVE